MKHLHPTLAARVIAQAREGSLVLTLHESRDLLDHLVESPRASVATPLGVVEIRSLPIHVLDPVDEPDLDFLDVLDDDVAWMRSHLASYLEGLLDVDDLRRLLP